MAVLEKPDFPSTWVCTGEEGASPALTRRAACLFPFPFEMWTWLGTTGDCTTSGHFSFKDLADVDGISNEKGLQLTLLPKVQRKCIDDLLGAPAAE